MNFSKYAPAGSSNAELVPEHNTSMKYYWMINAKGVKVPVAIHAVRDALGRGYIHTDNVLVEEDPKNNVRNNLPPESGMTPEEKTAAALTKLAETQEAMVEVAEEVTGKKRGRKKKVEETVATSDDASQN